jgi:hypothetical protein
MASEWIRSHRRRADALRRDAPTASSTRLTHGRVGLNRHAPLAELGRMRAALAELDRQCCGLGRVTGCPIIEALNGGHEHE